MLTKIQFFLAAVAVIVATGFIPATSTNCYGVDTPDRCDNSPPPAPRPAVVAAVRG